MVAVQGVGVQDFCSSPETPFRPLALNHLLVLGSMVPFNTLLCRPSTQEYLKQRGPPRRGEGGGRQLGKAQLVGWDEKVTWPAARANQQRPLPPPKHDVHTFR